MQVNDYNQFSESLGEVKKSLASLSGEAVKGLSDRIKRIQFDFKALQSNLDKITPETKDLKQMNIQLRTIQVAVKNISAPRLDIVDHSINKLFESIVKFKSEDVRSLNNLKEQIDSLKYGLQVVAKNDPSLKKTLEHLNSLAGNLKTGITNLINKEGIVVFASGAREKIQAAQSFIDKFMDQKEFNLSKNLAQLKNFDGDIQDLLLNFTIRQKDISIKLPPQRPVPDTPKDIPDSKREVGKGSESVVEITKKIKTDENIFGYKRPVLPANISFHSVKLGAIVGEFFVDLKHTLYNHLTKDKPLTPGLQLIINSLGDSGRASVRQLLDQVKVNRSSKDANELEFNKILDVLVLGDIEASYQKMNKAEVSGDLYRLINGHPSLRYVVKRPKDEQAKSVFEANIQKFKILYDRLKKLSPKESLYITPEVLKIKNGEQVIVNPVCNNGNLQDLMSNNEGGIRDGEIMKIGYSIASGLAILHQNGIVHNDLASRNILVEKKINESGDIVFHYRISDYGHSTVLERGQETHESAKKTGPLRWMSPERLQFRFESKYSDVWGFAVTFLETLTNQTPFSQYESAAEYSMALLKNPTLAQELLRQTPRFSSLNPNIQTLLLRCLDPNIYNRPTAEELASAFSR